LVLSVLLTNLIENQHTNFISFTFGLKK